MTNFYRIALLSVLLFVFGCRDAKAQFTFVGNFGGSGYYVSTGADNWLASFLKCNAAGLKLVHISSDAENTFVQGTTSQVAWIGIGTGANFNGNVLDMGNYRWADSVADPYWKFGSINGVPQPDNANGTQRCIVIHSADMSPADAWDDTEPYKEFVCVAEGPVCGGDVNLTATDINLGCGGTGSSVLSVLTSVTGASITWSGTGAAFLSSLSGSPVTFTPTGAGIFTLIATIKNTATGCTVNVTKTINVTDIFDTDEHGKKDKTKVVICHVPPKTDFTKVIPISALGGHLGHGDYCGPCKDAQARMIRTGEDDVINVYPNPTQSAIYVDVPERATVNLLDLQGRVIETQNVDHTAQFNLENHSVGMYILEVNYDGERYRTKVIKQ